MAWRQVTERCRSERFEPGHTPARLTSGGKSSGSHSCSNVVGFTHATGGTTSSSSVVGILVTDEPSSAAIQTGHEEHMVSGNFWVLKSAVPIDTIFTLGSTGDTSAPKATTASCSISRLATRS